MALILCYFTEFGTFRGALRKSMVEVVVVKKFTFAMSSPDEFLSVNVAKNQAAVRTRILRKCTRFAERCRKKFRGQLARMMMRQRQCLQ